MSIEDVDKLMEITGLEPITPNQIKSSVDVVEDCGDIISIKPSPYKFTTIYPKGKLDMSKCIYK